MGGFTYNMGLPQGNSGLSPAQSTGGAQNLPNLFGMGSSSGFGGYNAGISNVGGAGNLPQNGMTGQMGATSQGGMAGQMPAWLTQLMSGGQVQPQSSMSPNSALGSLSGQMGYLSNIAGGQGAGAPVNQMPAWNTMNQAEQYNIQQGADNLAEQFNNGGGLFSTAYGSAAGQYQQQATLGQNAQLTAAQTQAMQQANQTQLSASQQLSSQGYGALGTLSGQQYGAAQQAAGLSSTANLAGMQQQLGLQQLGLSGATSLGQLGQQNMLTGNTLGQSQLTANQNQLTAAYQNWYNSQPQNNPLLSMMYSGATGYPQMQSPTYEPGVLGSLLGGLGSLAGGVGALIP